uniref:Phage protein n=1 Tax=Romanomermis culicivorax TaxID=13658 RepID=A0A915I9C1_ROMCU
MEKVSQLLEYVREVSIFRGHPVCGFDVEKINQDRVAALFKRRQVDNPKGNQFARYISFVLTNGQTYIINTTRLTEKEWLGICPETFRLKGLFTEFYLIDVGPYQYDFTLWAYCDQFAKRDNLILK